MTESVGAVIVNYNAGEHLRHCVQSLRADGVAEIVVADNDSRDGSERAVAEADPEVVVLRTGDNLGFGTAANRGVAATTSPYVLIMNPDVVVEPGTVKCLATALDEDPNLAAVGPRITNLDGSRYPSARRFPDLPVAAGHAFLGFVWPENPFSRAYKLADRDHTRAQPVDWLSGACLLVRRTAFREVGGFDEAYFMYVEDVDLCWRLWRAGWRVGYEPAATVVHTVGVSSDQAPYRMILAHHVSMWRFAIRSTTGTRRILLPAVAAGLVVRTGLAWTQRAWQSWRSRS
jgi:N-acetylglucosaminyl-diphospho-decaprenol L-rhamnosyltransferase